MKRFSTACFFIFTLILLSCDDPNITDADIIVGIEKDSSTDEPKNHDSETQDSAAAGTGTDTDTADSSTADSELFCRYDEATVPVGSSFILPPCLGCNNYFICTEINGQAIMEESQCECQPEQCHAEDIHQDLYVGTSYLFEDSCCTCTSNFSQSIYNQGELNCSPGPCNDTNVTCEYSGTQYQIGEFGPGFACEDDDKGCLCELNNGVPSWKCMRCTNSQLPETGQSITIEGHCCTHKKYGSPAYNSSYIHCISGPCA